MSSLRFDGKVVIITGGGGALGRAYALLFASRGASVVVNDLGVSVTGTKDQSHLSSAEKVVEEIRKNGGKAIADHNDVSNGEKIVETAIREYGRIDIIINNAGILRDKSFAKMTDDMWDSIFKVHVEGAYKLTHAAWPYLVKQKYGRIIMTASAAGLYGNFGQANYSAAKMALVGFTNTLSKEGENANIYVNTIVPAAGSRMTETSMPAEQLAGLKPEYIAPIVVKLCHVSSKVNGRMFECGAGVYAETRLQRSPGLLIQNPNNTPPTPEQINEKWDKITCFPALPSDSSHYFNSAKDSLMAIMMQSSSTSHDVSSDSTSSSSLPTNATKDTRTKLTESKTEALKTTDSQSLKKTSIFGGGKDIPGNFKSETIINILKEFMDSDVVKKTKAIFVFDVTNSQKENKKWTIDLKNGEGAVYDGIATQVKPDAILSVSDDDFVSLVYQDVHPQKLFRTGKLKVKGNLALAMKFEQVLRSLEHKAAGKL